MFISLTYRSQNDQNFKLVVENGHSLKVAVTLTNLKLSVYGSGTLLLMF